MLELDLGMAHMCRAARVLSSLADNALLAFITGELDFQMTPIRVASPLYISGGFASMPPPFPFLPHRQLVCRQRALDPRTVASWSCGLVGAGSKCALWLPLLLQLL